jgi:hypothetical protein
MSENTVRTRSRAAVANVAVTERPEVLQVKGNVTISKEMLDLATEHFRQNEIKNKATAECKKLYTKLNMLMNEVGAENFDFEVDGVKAEAIIEASKENVVDVEKLRKRVDDATFMELVDISQTAVKNHPQLGTNALAAVLVEQTKLPALKVRKKK